MSLSELQYSRIPPEAEDLRSTVKDFLITTLAERTLVERSESWMGFDPAFSRQMGDKGWIGMSLPKQYGGSEAGLFARYVVIEELLAAGAPVAAHWMADRQSAPLILRYGTDAQKEKYLNGICKGEIFFCIGMSEPNAGSDLAAVSSRAKRDGNQWILNGCKLWTTNAHRSHYMIALVRTGESTSGRHGGLSQVIIDLKAEGVTVRPIQDLTGASHFNEVFFDDVVLTEDALVGTEGNGWQQVMAELALERSGPERYLSSMTLINVLIDAIGKTPDKLQASETGKIFSRLHTLRNMSISVTAAIDAGREPAWAASCVKDLGTSLEQDIPKIAQKIYHAMPRSNGGSEYEKVLAQTIQMAPSFSLRGGTREILRGIIARGIGA